LQSDGGPYNSHGLDDWDICLLVSFNSNHRHRKGLVTDVSGPQRNACPGTLTPKYFDSFVMAIATSKLPTENCSIPRSMALNFVVVGDARETHPIVRDEIYRIGYEAILNACVHSSASKLEIELTYGRNLTLRVADNGAGIDPAVTTQGKQGHFGLQGMQERAARIGGTFTLTSSSDAGTEIRLVVPGKIIFQTQKPIRHTLPAKLHNFVRRAIQKIKLD
jgi:signal transduction histidine kinase